MAALVRPPIFVLDRQGSLYVFDSVASTEAGLEINDVETGEYVALDAAGRPLLLTVVEGAKTGKWYLRPGDSVRLDLGAGQSQPELLRRVLIEALGSDVQLRDDSLESLVARARTGKNLVAGRIIGEVRAALISSGA
jgi:hypothetical protein